jgi:hypothetical protein
MVFMDAIRPSATPPNVSDDLQAVLDHLITGKPLDPELERRVGERAENIRAEILAKHGEINVAVELVREAREDS